MADCLDFLPIDIEVDQPLHPFDLSYRVARDQDFFPGPPVPGIDDDIGNVPAGFIDQKIRDMTDLAIGGMDMMPGDSPDTTQMRITQLGQGTGRSWSAIGPIRAPAVVLIDVRLVLPRHRLGRVDIRTVLDLLSAQFDSKMM